MDDDRSSSYDNESSSDISDDVGIEAAVTADEEAVNPEKYDSEIDSRHSDSDDDNDSKQDGAESMASGNSDSDQLSDDSSNAVEENSMHDELKLVSDELRSKLKKLSFQKLDQVKKEGFNGTPIHELIGLPDDKYINHWLAGAEISKIIQMFYPKISSSRENHAKKKSEEKMKISQSPKLKRKKHAPLEISSKNRVSRFQNVVKTSALRARDPRFVGMHENDVGAEVFSKRYKFLEEMQDNEIKELRETLDSDIGWRGNKFDSEEEEESPRKKVKLSKEERLDIHKKLTQLQQRRASGKREAVTRDVRKNIKKTEREKLKSGKKAFFLKRSEVKELENEAITKSRLARKAHKKFDKDNHQRK